jgi:allantoicase
MIEHYDQIQHLGKRKRLLLENMVDDYLDKLQECARRKDGDEWLKLKLELRQKIDDLLTEPDAGSFTMRIIP